MRLLLLTTLLLLGANAPGTTFSDQLVEAAVERTNHDVRYDGRYFSLAYPNGDVPANVGVCTDVVIRSYRALAVDLQQLVHEDMKIHFASYPSKRIWNLTHPDSNIDHRRVPNLQVFFSRHGQSLPITGAAKDYVPGDLVTWLLPENLPHIGIVTDQVNRQTGRPLVAHNIGAGPVLQDMLFAYPISGHYRYSPGPAD